MGMRTERRFQAGRAMARDHARRLVASCALLTPAEQRALALALALLLLGIAARLWLAVSR